LKGVYINVPDRASVENQLQARNVHPEEVRRLAEFGDLPETAGQELIAVVQQGQAPAWFAQDRDDPAYVTTNIHHAPALDLERRIASGIGADMTEQEWFHEPDPQGLLEYIGQRLSARKVRLFAVACCQTMVSFMNSPQKLALHIAEDYADGLASDDDLLASLQAILSYKASSRDKDRDQVKEDLDRALHVALYSEKIMDWYVSADRLKQTPALTPYSRGAFSLPFNYAIMTSVYLAQAMASLVTAGDGTPAQDEMLRRTFGLHARLLRDVVGNPFNDVAERVAAISRSRPHIRLFAARMYLTTTFHNIPRLAQLVYEEGLKSAPIVEAMQEDVGYVKGFWLVDAAAGLA